nr:hypothetical protein [Algoriphagus sp.]
MEKRYRIFGKLMGLIALVMLITLGANNQVNAQFNNVKPFNKRVGTPSPPNGIFQVKGDYTLIGNTNLTVQPYGDNTENGNNQMVYVDIDGIQSTLNSSSATLQFSQENGADPNCSEILYAGLYWSGRSTSDQYTASVTQINTGNFNLFHNGTIGNGTSYSMAITRGGSSENRYPIYTFSGPGGTYAFHLTNVGTGPNSLHVYYTINGGSPIYPTNQSRQTNNPSNSQERVTFDPVLITDGQLTISVNRLTRNESEDGSEADYQSNSNFARVSVRSQEIILDKRKVKLKGPSSSNYIDVTASNANIQYSSAGALGDIFVGYADVTQYVKANGLGEYTVADLALIEGNGGGIGYFGQWGLVVVYENSKLPWRDITMFDGFSFVQSPGSGALAEGILNITGFNSVQNGNVNVKLGVMAGEGDRGIPNDFLEIEEGVNTNVWRRLAHDSTSTSNFFNSSIFTPTRNSSNVLVQNPRNPRLRNNTGIDIAMWNIDNSGNQIIGNSQTSTRFKYGSTQDLYAIYFFAFAVDAYIPDIEGLNQLQTINGTSVIGNPNPTVEPGQLLTYKLDVRNRGTEAVTNGEIV